MNRFAWSPVFAGACTIAFAATTPSPIRAEIDALLARLEASGCEFNRNGSWHSAAQARAYLVTKLEFLEGQRTLQSTEQFIELGASSSSFSGKPYEVRCGAHSAMKSREWLTRELAAIRSAGARP